MKRSDKIVAWAVQTEGVAVDLVAIAAPWLAPIPSAYLVYRSADEVLGWHPAVAVAAAIAIESIGVTSIVNALRLWDWNGARSAKDGRAPFELAAVVCGIYVSVTIGLTVLMDVIPALAFVAPGIFPLLALVGGLSIGIRNGQKQREAERLKRLGKRSNQRSAGVQSKPASVQPEGNSSSKKERLAAENESDVDAEAENKDSGLSKAEIVNKLLLHLGQNKNASLREAGEAVGRSKSWAHGQIKQLENDGRLEKNDEGWVVR